MIAAEFGTGQVLWSLVWFFLFVVWISLVISIFVDIVRAHDISGFTKALWTFAIIFLPFLGVFLYLIVNGDDMSRRADNRSVAQQDAFNGYIQSTVESSPGGASELASLASLHDAGKLTDSEFAAAKAKLIAG